MHFPLIALKPTEEKDSFCLLSLVFDRLYKRLFLILCKDITLIMRFIADGLCTFMSDRLIPSTFPTLCKDIILLVSFFSKSLAIGPPASQVVSIRVQST